MYTDAKVRLRSENQISQQFKMKNGLRQGGCLILLLFIFMMNEFRKDAKTITKGTNVVNLNVKRIYLNVCACADDEVIFAKNQDNLQLT